jgi:methionine-rich copper-binding protein CopC
MSRTPATARVALACFCFLAIIAARSDGHAADVRRHAHLVKSEPANNDTLARSPVAIRLWFSEQVELVVTTVKLTDGGGGTIALSPLTRPDTGESAPVLAALRKPLAPGNYTVTWKTAAKDGHASNGTFVFSMKARH